MSEHARNDYSTIFALSSAPGRAGVAVVRISGSRALSTLKALAGCVPPTRMATLKALRDPSTGELLDEALVLCFPRPDSFTGEDVVELHIHGGRAVVDGVLSALAGQDGLRMAEAGEFARRAFENGKLDLTRVEGLADLIDAETEAQRRQAVEQMGGALERLYGAWRERLIEAQALMEAGLDFSDEADVLDRVIDEAVTAVRALSSEISDHLDDGRRGEILRSGYRVVLAGPTNAGKSSLLNALAGRDAAIVSAEAGTTRDVIEVHLNLAGYPVIVSDTAGVRETTGEIESEGIRRTVDRMRNADLVVWLSDATAANEPEVDEINVIADQRLAVHNKIDLLSPEMRVVSVGDALPISALTGEGVRELVDHIAAHAKSRLEHGSGPTPTNARQRQHLENCRVALERFLAANDTSPELRAEDLRQAADALGRITGHIDVENILDKIFAGFCIGK